MLKVVCILAVALLACNQLEAVPFGQQKSITEMSHAELMHKFEKFMSDDKEAAAIRQLYQSELAMRRSKRQAEDNGMEGMDNGDAGMERAEGFLDRAAKFVLELVQRFLKWINTE